MGKGSSSIILILLRGNLNDCPIYFKEQFKKTNMKSFWERFSVTKLVLLLLVLALIFIEVWHVVNGDDIDQLFTDVLIAVISFYFGQKGISYDSVDSLVEKGEKVEDRIGFDLDSNEEEDGGTD